jgi:hypothetical protein
VNKHQKLLDNAHVLLDLKKQKSFTLFKSCLFLFKLSLIRQIVLIISGIFIYIFLQFFLFDQVSAVKIISDLTVNLNAIMVPIFAVVITGYAIFQALANGSTLIRMISINHGEQLNKFAVYNLYFYGLSLFYLALIVINSLFLFTIKYVKEDWSFYLFSSYQNELICATIITIYILVVLNFLIELKSFIYNLFQIFITNGVIATTDYLEENKGE